jgi:hypothetical protein
MWILTPIESRASSSKLLNYSRTEMTWKTENREVSNIVEQREVMKRRVAQKTQKWVYCFLFIGCDIDEFMLMLLFSRQNTLFYYWNTIFIIFILKFVMKLSSQLNTHPISMFAFLSKFLNSFSCKSKLGFRAGSKLKMLCYFERWSALWACFALLCVLEMNENKSLWVQK